MDLLSIKGEGKNARSCFGAAGFFCPVIRQSS
jgi:hypothetical protein